MNVIDYISMNEEYPIQFFINLYYMLLFTRGYVFSIIEIDSKLIAN